MILSGIVVVTVGTILVCTTGEPREQLVFDGKLVQMDVAPFRVVNVVVETDEQLNNTNVSIKGDFTILPTVSGQSRLSCPEGLKRYLSLVAKGDTLNLVFEISTYTLPEQYKRLDWIGLEFSEMTLTADSSLVAVHSKVNQMGVSLMNLKSDSLSLKASQADVDSCDFRSLFVEDTSRLKLKNSQIHNAYLDLDNVRSWSASDCQIENEYLTGSERHHNNLQKGECRQVHWLPKNEDAELRITLKEAATVTLRK